MYPEVELLDHMAILYFSFFEEPLYCFPLWLYCLIFSLTVHKASNFFASLPTPIIFCFVLVSLLSSYPNRDVKWYLIVVLTFISLMINDTEHFIMCLFAIYISYLKKYLFKTFVHF